MSERPTFKHNIWEGLVRTADGTIVDKLPRGWIVRPSGDRPLMSTCPCCHKPFTTSEIAQAAADGYFPVNPGDSNLVDADGKLVSPLDILARLLRPGQPGSPGNIGC